MTNEEKAREIINCGDWCESINKCNYKNTGVKCYAYGIAMRMAGWKDEQFKTKIEELFKALEKEGYNDRVKSGFEIFKDKIIEL